MRRMNNSQSTSRLMEQVEGKLEFKYSFEWFSSQKEEVKECCGICG